MVYKKTGSNENLKCVPISMTAFCTHLVLQPLESRFLECRDDAIPQTVSLSQDEAAMERWTLSVCLENLEVCIVFGIIFGRHITLHDTDHIPYTDFLQETEIAVRNDKSFAVFGNRHLICVWPATHDVLMPNSLPPVLNGVNGSKACIHKNMSVIAVGHFQDKNLRIRLCISSEVNL